MANILANLDIKYLTGRTADTVQIDVIRGLFKEGTISGIQLRVGSEFTNGETAVNLLEIIDREIGMPFVIHGPFECHGVDMGMSFDESGDFERFKKETSQTDWEKYNMDAIRQANIILSSDQCIGNYNLLHAGYARNEPKEIRSGLERIRKALLNLWNGQSISLETIPSLVFSRDFSRVTHYGFGGTPDEMMALLHDGELYDGKVLIDFSHLSVQANQMACRSGLFERRMSYEQLVWGFLTNGMDVNPYCHFSGHWDGLRDMHPGFTCEAAPGHKVDATREAFKYMDERFGQVSIIVELKFRNLEHAKREIGTLQEKYLSKV